MNNESTPFKQTIMNLINEKNDGTIYDTSEVMQAYMKGEFDVEE